MAFKLEKVNKTVRKPMARLAAWVHKVGRGRITPNMITWAGLILHIPIALLITQGYLWPSAILLVVFGLFDTLDGELARLTNQASPAGMLLDASTDRIKETFIHGGIAYYLIQGAHPEYAIFAVLALGFSLSVTYLKAKAEVAYAVVHKGNIDYHELNRKFSDGIFPFEVRMALVVGGLFTGFVVLAEILICLGAWQSPKSLRFINQSISTGRKLG
ncbi:MAG TPA: CDP-alcohol phosphatidyltransferase family protein [Candidatus Saccharimonadia bacterium]|jgi:phosphatidylglycerophosphate synthase